VLHELRVQVDQGETRVEGFVDLLWRDDDGAWHLLDYKATEVDADAAVGGDGLEARIRHYHPQVSLYATALEGRLPEGQSLASYGLWFVREGRVVRWAVGDGREEP
jgi:ATP-dependent exoDNAse (exonuclease V) beta subunit